MDITGKEVVVRLSKRADNHLLKEAGLTKPTHPVPWLGGRQARRMPVTTERWYTTRPNPVLLAPSEPGQCRELCVIRQVTGIAKVGVEREFVLSVFHRCVIRGQIGLTDRVHVQYDLHIDDPRRRGQPQIILRQGQQEEEPEMSPFSPLFESRTSLMGGSIALILVLKWTVVLALAWMIHASLSRCNPRWRVLLWRSTVAGLAVVAISSSAPPILEYGFTERGSTAIDVARSQPSILAEKNRKKPEVLGVNVATEAANTPPSLVLDAATTNQSDSDQTSLGLEPVLTVGETPWAPRLSYWLPSIWLAGVVVFISRLMVGSLSLARLVRRSSEVPDWIVGECRAIAGRLGCSRAVRVRRSTEVRTPFLTGVWQPVLLLPDQSCPELEAKYEDLCAILAHELTHARNNDLFWNLAASLASIVLWFHPLAWRIRAVHASACDAVCDAVAADTIGDVASYGRTLARLALHAAQRLPAQGLAMARACDVRRRLDALNRKVFRSTISPKRILPALLAGGVILLLIGGFGFTRRRASPGCPGQ